MRRASHWGGWLITVLLLITLPLSGSANPLEEIRGIKTLAGLVRQTRAVAGIRGTGAAIEWVAGQAPGQDGVAELLASVEAGSLSPEAMALLGTEPEVVAVLAKLVPDQSLALRTVFNHNLAFVGEESPASVRMCGHASFDGGLESLMGHVDALVGAVPNLVVRSPQLASVRMPWRKIGPYVTDRAFFVYPNDDQMTAALAEEIVQRAGEAIEARGVFTFVLTGGRTTQKLYRVLAEQYADAIDWNKVRLFVQDERMVPDTDDLSNIRMARELLIGPVGAPAKNVTYIRADLGTPEAAAAEYQRAIAKVFADIGQPVAPGEMPKFDLVLSGMGGDGHVAASFPNRAAAPVVGGQTQWVTGVSAPNHINPMVDRVTMTIPLMNAARSVFFQVTTPEKTPVLTTLLRDPVLAESMFPAAMVKTETPVVWLIDEAAIEGPPAMDLPNPAGIAPLARGVELPRRPVDVEVERLRAEVGNVPVFAHRGGIYGPGSTIGYYVGGRSTQRGVIMEVYRDGHAWVRPSKGSTGTDTVIQITDQLTGVNLVSPDRVPLPTRPIEDAIRKQRAEVGVVDSTPFKGDAIRVGTEIGYYVGGPRGQRGVVMEVYADGRVWVRTSGVLDSLVDVNEQLASVSIVGQP